MRRPRAFRCTACAFRHGSAPSVARVTDGVPRSQLVLYAAAALVVALLGARYLGPDGGGAAPAPSRAPAPAARVEQARTAGATVHVAGAVREPGVYRLRPGERIDDAIRRAGGATSRADLSAVNLAAKVADGRQVLVPERAPRAPAPAGAGAAGAGGAAAPAGAAAAGPSAAAPAQPINLNTATLEQLDTLAGVGPATAQKILAFREARGGFGSVDELAQVPGIGDKRLASLKEQVTV